MKHANAEVKITVSCPSGHRLRGDTKLVGKTVRCPKCEEEFVFAPTKPPRPQKPSVTDTAVLRILGDMPKPSDEPQLALLDLRPCDRCGIPVPDSVAVCSHCNHYLGVMPTFMQQLASEANVQQN